VLRPLQRRRERRWHLHVPHHDRRHRQALAGTSELHTNVRDPTRVVTISAVSCNISGTSVATTLPFIIRIKVLIVRHFLVAI
jgi:hypothetical protein